MAEICLPIKGKTFYLHFDFNVKDKPLAKVLEPNKKNSRFYIKILAKTKKNDYFIWARQIFGVNIT